MDEEKLIADNMGLVYKGLHKFKLAYDSEAFSCAMEALMNAARTYDSSKAVKFSTYATVCIYNGIGRYVRQLNKKRVIETVSYEETIQGCDELTYCDMLGSDNTPETQLLQKELVGNVGKAIAAVYDTLPTTAKLVVDCWQESGFTATQKDIAKEVGVTQAAVSRILSVFRYKLKKELEDYVC